MKKTLFVALAVAVWPLFMVKKILAMICDEVGDLPYYLAHARQVWSDHEHDVAEAAKRQAEDRIKMEGRP
jgi:hypothetical protein